MRAFLFVLLFILSHTAEAQVCTRLLREKRPSLGDLTGLFTASLRGYLPWSIRKNAEIVADGSGASTGISMNAQGDLNRTWIRDYSPFKSGRHFVSYVSPITRFSRFVPQDFRRDLRSTDLILEGGAIQYVEGDAPFLLVSEKMFGLNAKSIEDYRRELTGAKLGPSEIHRAVRNLTDAGYRARDFDGVLNELARASEVPRERIVVLPWMPGERTGHSDMYVGVVGKTAVVPRIPAEMIGRLGFEFERVFATATNGFLEQIAAKLGSRGIAVERIPMLPPRNLYKSSVSPLGWDAKFPSTANWYIDYRDAIAFVPNFQKHLGEFPEAVRLNFIAEIRETLDRLGLDTEFIEASELLQSNGLLHCVTAEK